MAYDFNIDEVFEMAQQLEKNGAKYYRLSAESVSDPGEKQLLNELAQMEDEHEKTFSALRKTLSKTDKQNTVFDPNDESGQYLKALADTQVFFKKDLDTSSMKAILKGAILAEKDSIVFYLGMKDAVPEGLGKDKIEAIIKEEMGHIRDLSKRLVAVG